MRIVRDFNQDWLFVPERVEPDCPDERFAVVTLPHTNKTFARPSVDNADYQFVSTYRKRFTIHENLDGRRIFIDFDGVMLVSIICLNNTSLGVHQGGYTPFSVEITDQVVTGENVLTVYVDATEDEHVPPYGGRVDFLTFGGIYREVRLRIVNDDHITSVFARPLDALTAPRLECDVELARADEHLSVDARVEDAHGNVIAAMEQGVRERSFSLCFADIGQVTLWSLEDPALYRLVVTLLRDGVAVDQVGTRFGFRSAEFRPDGSFYLNGVPLKLFGLNRHQTYPYIGAAAPKRLQEMDADVLKYELACNVVRTSHYPQSPHFLNRCDEIGLLVFEELAGWQYIGDAEWQALALQDLQAMIERDRNHPSIILWGVRVNESPDSTNFYRRTNSLAHDLDPTRQTGGVRDFITSEFLEDVFTLNDFPDGIQTPLVRPHLITEFAGHAFPTKTWDHEARRVEHALKHARKHDLQLGHADVAGGIGWCAFDYHTHPDFGSGDRICYHGVMDIYRLPKMAAHFYRSQKSPRDEIVLYAATNWTMGDRDRGGNNPLTVFSNCDEIEVLIGDVSQGCCQPDFEAYPHLSHPPFTIRWAEPYNPWGAELSDLTVRGFVGGQMVVEHRIDSLHRPYQLRLTTSASRLHADGSDMARIAVQLVDKYGNVLPYQMRIVRLTIAGDAELIGEVPLALLGGQAAWYLRARHTAGQVTIRCEADEMLPAEVTIQIGE